MQGPYKAAPAHPADLSVYEFALALSASLPQNFSLPSRQENAPDFFAGGIHPLTVLCDGLWSIGDI